MSSSAHSPAKQVNDVIGRSRETDASPSPLLQGIRAVLKPLASLRITIVLFVLSLFLVLAGTLAQVDYGIWTVMETYFRTWVAWVELQIFVPNEWAMRLGLIRETGDVVKVPFPGGYVLGGAMVINLVAAHAIRFKLVAQGQRLMYGIIGTLAGLALMIFAIAASTKIVWPLSAPIQFGPAIALSMVALGVMFYPSMILYGKRTGIMLLHAGIVMLLVNELVTGLGAYEGRMEIRQQGISNFTYNLEESELAFIESQAAGNDRVVAIPQWMLERSAASGEPIKDERLPFHVKVVSFFKNSRLEAVTPDQAAQRKDPATAGEVRLSRANDGQVVKQYVAEPVKVGTGADGAGVADVSSGYVTLIDKETGENVGTYLVSSFFTATIGQEHMDTIDVNKKQYQMGMRFAREYKPYSVHLVEFRHDRFIGTDKARNFSSEVVLIDEDHPDGREALIRMNEPLRYRGETFFQAAFLPSDSGTVLQVVRNPGYLMPYIACIVVSLGMMMHFTGHLQSFFKKVIK